MLSYPITMTAGTAGAVLVAFPDLPEANFAARDEDHAAGTALDALEAALGAYVEQRRPIPPPSKARKGQSTAALPALSAARVLLWNEMMGQNLRKVDLAVRLGVHTPQVDRLFDFGQAIKFELIEQAARALGKRIDLSLA
jgi:antitoxin HicB